MPGRKETSPYSEPFRELLGRLRKWIPLCVKTFAEKCDKQAWRLWEQRDLTVLLPLTQDGFTILSPLSG